MSSTTKNHTQIAAVVHAIADLIADGLPGQPSIELYSPLTLHFFRDDIAAVDAWADVIGGTPELDAHIFNKGDSGAWQKYMAEGTLAGYPVQVWAGRTVTR